MKVSRLTAAIGIALVTGLFAGASLAIDLVEAAPQRTKVLVDNEKVRVIHVTLKKGDKIPMHSHPDMVVYTIKGGKMKFINADGKVIEANAPAGDVAFRPAVTHSHEHPDGGEAIVIELKK